MGGRSPSGWRRQTSSLAHTGCARARAHADSGEKREQNFCRFAHSFSSSRRRRWRKSELCSAISECLRIFESGARGAMSSNAQPQRTPMLVVGHAPLCRTAAFGGSILRSTSGDTTAIDSCYSSASELSHATASREHSIGVAPLLALPDDEAESSTAQNFVERTQVCKRVCDSTVMSCAHDCLEFAADKSPAQPARTLSARRSLVQLAGAPTKPTATANCRVDAAALDCDRRLESGDDVSSRELEKQPTENRRF